MMKRIKFLIIFLAFLFAGGSMFAQPQLPDIGVVSQGGINILSWINPYTSGVSNIKVERSADSLFNFTTIGLVKGLQEARQSFVDAHPMVGANWYMITITFSSGTEWTSNKTHILVDSASIASRKPLPNDDSLQRLISQLGTISEESAANIISQQEAYPQSKYVFTNPFTGNIDIELPDALRNDYALYFYDSNDKQVLMIPRINDVDVILDKRNFQTTGVFKFKLIRNGKEEFETGHVTIY